MLERLVRATHSQFETISHLAVRDVWFQLASGLVLCAICSAQGFHIAGLIVGCYLIVAELVVMRLARRRPPFDGLARDQTIVVMLLICMANTVAYLYPAVLLTGVPSFAVKITAILWIMGVQVYIANSWTRVPAFLFGMLLPAMMLLAVAFLRLSVTPPTASTPTEWAIAFAFVLMFIYSSVDTLRQHLEMEAELSDAQKESQLRLQQLEEAYRLDTLTGLLNRPAFDKSLKVMLEDRVEGSGEEIAVFLVDLDSFKPINDTYSHEAGDAVLIEISNRLRQQIGDDGIVGRLGGDEFACAVPLSAEDEASRRTACKILAAVTGPIEWHDRLLSVGASVGYAVTGPSEDAPAATVAALCSAADQAMYASKHAPSGQPQRYRAQDFQPRMNASDRQHLSDAIRNKRVRPHYQPKVHLPTGQIIGFEALARWDHGNLGLQSPVLFMEQIEELGLQADFMETMAKQVVADISVMLKAGLDPGQVSLNVSEVALATHSGRDDLLALFKANPDVARCLTIEITEDVFIARSAETIQASIAAFRALGLRISLDDFGTGFASFHHLRQLEFDELKIDTSFVAALGLESTSEVLVRGFLDIASGLGVSVVAEGVETEAQARDLINMGCMVAQGYLYSAAVPRARAMDLLRDQQAA